MIPPTLLKEAEAAAEVFERDYGYGAKQMRFIAGARWLFTRLLEMSEGEFDESTTDNSACAFAGVSRVGDTDGLSSPLESNALFNDPRSKIKCFIEGARHQHALSQAALLKAKEEIADYIKTIKLQGEKVERMERELKYIEGRIAHHAEAYSLDIFPDDKRDPCQTTAGRMGRHMCRVFLDYFNEARRALEEAE